MKILLFSDIHCDWKALESLLEQDADYYLCAGDVVSWARSLEQAGQILQKRKGRVFLLPGNHESAGNIQTLCEKWGLEAVHERCWTLGGVRFAALGYSNPTPFQTPGEYTEEELTLRLDRFVSFAPQVLVCHCPPKNTPLDRAGEGRHFGSSAIAAAIEKMQPEWFFCGHIHEAEGQRCRLGKEGRTQGVNLGKRGFLLDLAVLESA